MQILTECGITVELIMENLLICRMCLRDDIRLLSIVGTHLQEMHEALVLIPLESKNVKPILVCYICRARLKNCYELRKSCLQSEEVFTQMLSCNESEQVQLQAINNKKRLTMHNVIHFSVGHVLRMDEDNVGVENLKCEVKDEPNDDEDINPYIVEENGVSDNMKSEDSDDDFLINVKEEQIGQGTSDSTWKERPQDVQRGSEGSTSSNLNEHELVQDAFKNLHEVTAADITDDSKEKTASVQYTCNTCQQCYSSKRELERHVRLCSNVWKKDLSRMKMTNHTRDHLKNYMRKYTGEKPYHCDICKKQFSHKDNLTKHMRTHTGEKPYHCDICKKQFSEKGNLKRHLYIHTDEKPYRCDICEKQFSHECRLIEHRRIHTVEIPYYCYICKKQFSHKDSLTKHMRTHTGEKPYHCDICKKQFSQKSHFTIHNNMRTHTGEKPHFCDICNKQFSDTSPVFKKPSNGFLKTYSVLTRRLQMVPHQSQHF